MSTREQRKHERFEVFQDLAGQLRLKTSGDVWHLVKGIKDVSSAGVSVFLDVELPVAEHVAIEYQGQGMCLDVYGTVEWCAASDTLASLKPERTRGRFLLGVELMSPLLLLACLPKH